VKKSNKKKIQALPRNWFAVHAHNRRAENHGDARKKKSKRECREFKWTS